MRTHFSWILISFHAEFMSRLCHVHSLRCNFVDTDVHLLKAPLCVCVCVCVQGAVSVLSSLVNDVAASQRLLERQKHPDLQLQSMQSFLQRSGITVDQLDRLNIIHVTGTKGKGSTCAFTERILRNHGLRTGFYSSPHLVHVRERIRIDGWPIGKELFTKYFWETMERLEDTKDLHGGSTPFYFQFLTLLAFHVFLQEKVDLAVVEVGIGGQYDCTNIIRNPWVCGVTSLGLDHCSLLGDTLEEIALQKAGIFKPGVPAFTVSQKPGAMRVLQRRAEEIQCPLVVSPELHQYEAAVGPVRLGLAGSHQRLNASLALQLSSSWLQRHKAQRADNSAHTLNGLNSQNASFQPSMAMLRGLQETEWPGRSQTLSCGPVTYYLDGAHTAESMQACVSWFSQETLHRDLKVLLFNTTGERDSAALLSLLVTCGFDFALFCPNISESPISQNFRKNHSLGVQMLDRCRENQNIWESLNAPRQQQLCRPLVAGAAPCSLAFPCILSALQWISRMEQPPSGGLQAPCSVSVLVTGSLHLVGGALKLLEPSLNSQ
uniref:Folylpolyglutamate synthase n=1 Tax=Salarias fasciatus TaxID=181472 RepID=A0A672HL00_SALFA